MKTVYDSTLHDWLVQVALATPGGHHLLVCGRHEHALGVMDTVRRSLHSLPVEVNRQGLTIRVLGLDATIMFRSSNDPGHLHQYVMGYRLTSVAKHETCRLKLDDQQALQALVR